MKRRNLRVLLVVVLTAVTALGLGGYREYRKSAKTVKIVSGAHGDDLGESLRRQFVGHTTRELLDLYRVEFANIDLHQEPPGELAGASFVTTHDGAPYRIRVLFSDDVGQPSRSLMFADWSKSFVESLKIGDIEVQKVPE